MSNDGFPLGKMNGDFAGTFIWACAFLFVYGLSGGKLPELLDQSKQIHFNLCFISKYISIRSNRRWLLMIWTIPTYLQMFFQLFCHCSRVNYINYNNKFCISRSSRPEVFCKKVALKTSAKFTRNHLCWSLFLMKLQA